MIDKTEEEAARHDALALIASLHVCTLATCDGGQPHAVSLFYAQDRFDLYWFSDPSARHSRHIDGVQQAWVAATIAADHQDFESIRGVQISGAAQRLSGPIDIAAGMARLAGRYSFLKSFFEGPAGLVNAMRKAAIYRLATERVTFIDNSKGFGHKTTFSPGS